MNQTISVGKPNRGRQAAILVLTLWIVVVLGLISASMLEEVYLELKLAKYQRDDFEAMVLARAGVARAIADLRNDLMIDYAGKHEMIDSTNDVWARMDEDKVGQDNKGVPLGRGTYWVWVEDEWGKFNLNMANLPVLKAALYELGLEERDAQTVASAILDWFDPDDRALPPGTGFEDEYYSEVIAKKSHSRWDKDQPPIYHCKNDRFSSVDELLSICGVTPELFYGVDPEKEALPDPIERLKSRAERAGTPNPREKQFGLRDIFTVYSAGPINVNTADRTVLRILFRAVLNDPQAALASAEKVLAMRKSTARASSKDEKAFRDITQFAQAAGLPPHVLDQLNRVAPLTIRSDTYRIYALGEVNGTRHLICAVVARSLETCNPDSLNSLFDQGIINRRLMEAFLRRHRDKRELIEQATVRVTQWQEL